MAGIRARIRRMGRHAPHTAWLIASAALALSAGCGLVEEKPPATPTPTATPQTLWLDYSVLERADGIVGEKVSYLSGTLKIWAEIYRPDDAKRRTLLLWNHGGFGGLFDGDRSFCRELAKQGFVVAASYYRGEGGSQGRVEACKGEVDDVLTMLAILRQHTYVDVAHVAVLGASHGGCIALSVAIRDSQVKVAVDLAGPSDWALLHTWLSDQLARGEPLCAQIGRTDCAALHRDMLQQLESGLGGTPAQVPQAYAERSPYLRLSELKVPLLMLHGANDVIVNLDQTCRKRTALSQAGRAPAAWYVDTGLHERANATVCGGGFSSRPVLISAPFETNSLAIYEGQGHELKDNYREHIATLVAAFVIAHL